MSSNLLEEASKVITNTAVLINLVSRRVRQLSNGQRPLVEIGPRMSNADIALQAIIEHKLVYEVVDPSRTSRSSCPLSLRQPRSPQIGELSTIFRSWRRSKPVSALPAPK